METLKQILSSYTVNASTITNDTKIREDLELDSLQLINIMVALEDAYNIVIPDSAVNDIYTIEDVLNIINEKKVKD